MCLSASAAYFVLGLLSLGFTAISKSKSLKKKDKKMIIPIIDEVFNSLDIKTKNKIMNEYIEEYKIENYEKLVYVNMCSKRDSELFLYSQREYK